MKVLLVEKTINGELEELEEASLGRLDLGRVLDVLSSDDACLKGKEYQDNMSLGRTMSKHEWKVQMMYWFRREKGLIIASNYNTLFGVQELRPPQHRRRRRQTLPWPLSPQRCPEIVSSATKKTVLMKIAITTIVFSNDINTITNSSLTKNFGPSKGCTHLKVCHLNSVDQVTDRRVKCSKELILHSAHLLWSALFMMLKPFDNEALNNYDLSSVCPSWT